MKICIRGDSVRLRLTQTDRRNLGQQGYVQKQTHFVNAIFGYRLQCSNTANDMHADFSGGKITVFIPDYFVKTLVETDRVGYDAYHPSTITINFSSSWKKIFSAWIIPSKIKAICT
ncbi:MAG: hypothetical protein KF746_18300 [Chitinophagaceae bacterium]|nr:hypothetical protein [Chitinophagaceae bacterium]